MSINRGSGRQLLTLVTQAGFTNVKSIPQVIRLPHGMFVRTFDGFIRSSMEKGQLAKAVTRWLEGLEQSADLGPPILPERDPGARFAMN